MTDMALIPENYTWSDGSTMTKRSKCLTYYSTNLTNWDVTSARQYKLLLCLLMGFLGA